MESHGKMTKIIQYPPLPVDDLLRRIRDDLENIYRRENEEILKARVTLYKKKFAGAAALKELANAMLYLSTQLEGE